MNEWDQAQPLRYPTRDIVQNVYLRRVKERNGKLVNINFYTAPMVKDPWPSWNPE